MVCSAAGRLLPTIRSRCRRLRMGPVSDPEAVAAGAGDRAIAGVCTAEERAAAGGAGGGVAGAGVRAGSARGGLGSVRPSWWGRRAGTALPELGVDAGASAWRTRWGAQEDAVFGTFMDHAAGGAWQARSARRRDEAAADAGQSADAGHPRPLADVGGRVARAGHGCRMKTESGFTSIVAKRLSPGLGPARATRAPKERNETEVSTSPRRFIT